MSLISDNLKFLRKKISLTQEQMAQQIGIKRSLLGAYEEGRADPRISNLLKFAEIFNLSVDQLIGTDLAVKNSSVTDEGNIQQARTNLRVLSITVDKNDRENIELVPQKAAAGYLNGYADPEYIEELPKFQLPVLPENATYRAFEISGDSMLPLRSGTIIIGQFEESFAELKNGKTYILVTRDEGIVYKRIFKYADNPELFCFTSDNKQYSAYDVNGADILEVWEAKAFISMEFPDPADDEEFTLKRLADIVLDLQREVIKLKDK
ncbi:MAG: helix-turn-helix domain-containing protein [Cyclobacteriaceae bacterium]|nr:helix-turn-helix domain-containing protein [Cyclobacteriaceae bacterium]